MTTFLIRSFDDAKSYAAVDYPGGSLPRSREESYVPWGLAADGRPVYAKTGEHTGWRGNSLGLRPYDSEVSQKRRRLCQSELGMIALNQRGYTHAAVSAVSQAMVVYLKGKYGENWANAVGTVYDEIGHYFFTGGRTGFGRLSMERKDDVGAYQVWRKILAALTNGTLDQIMAIHDAIGRKVLPKLGGGPKVEYDKIGPIVRQDWFDDKARRGRADVKGSKPTTVGGIAEGGTGDTHQARSRGVDMFKRDIHRTRDEDADAYYDDVDARNLLFGAGISGTTGTLLQAGIAFGKLNGEGLKQYVMAIVGYLVGGGMHSYHETMAVASKLGVPYNPGAYEISLPSSFTATQDYKGWRAKYYDIVVLGALHWRHNRTCLPSHLNTDLTPA